MKDSRRYRDLLMFQYGALDGLLSMREVTSDVTSAKELTSKLRSVLENWANDIVQFVGEQANLP